MLQRTVRAVGALAVLVALVAPPAGGAIASADHQRSMVHRSWFAYPDFVPTLKAGEYVVALRTAEMWDAVNTIVAYASAVEAQRLADEAAAQQAERERIAAYVRAQQYRPPAPRPSAISQQPTAGGGGWPSEAFWHKVAVCEEGGQNHPTYGYFGKIDGAWAGLSWGEQVARARALWNQYWPHINDTRHRIWTSYPTCTGEPF